MPAGLQVWDANGNLIFDTTSIVGRFIAIIDASAVNGSVVIPGMDQGTPFAVPILLESTGTNVITVNTLPVVTFAGNQVSWTRQPYSTGHSMPNCNLVLGVR